MVDGLADIDSFDIFLRDEINKYKTLIVYNFT